MEKTLIELLKKGLVFVYGECRGAKVELVRYVDKKTGQASAFTSLTILVERVGLMDVVMISQNVGDGTVDLATFKMPVEKGKTCAFELSTLESVRGVLRARMPLGSLPRMM